MAKERIETRKYIFSDGLFKQIADGIVNNLRRDIAQFNSRGISNARIDSFEEMIEAFDLAPYDDVLLGNVAIATENKDSKAEELRVALRSIRTIAENTFGKKNTYFRIYRFDLMNNHPDEILHRLARTTINIATEQLNTIPEIATEGLTQSMIDKLQIIDNEFETLIDCQLTAIRKRDISTQNRIEKGNILYKEMRKLCNIGKDIFASNNHSLYKSYLIFNTPTSKAPPANTTGMIHGKAVDSSSNAPIDRVQIYFPDINEAIETDSEGMYYNDVVPLNCNTFTAKHKNYNDYIGTFTILPDKEISYDFKMVAKE